MNKVIKIIVLIAIIIAAFIIGCYFALFIGTVLFSEANYENSLPYLFLSGGTTSVIVGFFSYKKLFFRKKIITS